jgi:hypothetical protein
MRQAAPSVPSVPFVPPAWPTPSARVPPSGAPTAEADADAAWPSRWPLVTSAAGRPRPSLWPLVAAVSPPARKSAARVDVTRTADVRVPREAGAMLPDVPTPLPAASSPGAPAGESMRRPTAPARAPSPGPPAPAGERRPAKYGDRR